MCLWGLNHYRPPQRFTSQATPLFIHWQDVCFINKTWKLGKPVRGSQCLIVTKRQLCGKLFYVMTPPSFLDCVFAWAMLSLYRVNTNRCDVIDIIYYLKRPTLVNPDILDTLKRDKTAAILQAIFSNAFAWFSFAGDFIIGLDDN